MQRRSSLSALPLCAALFAACSSGGGGQERLATQVHPPSPPAEAASSTSTAPPASTTGSAPSTTRQTTAPGATASRATTPAPTNPAPSGPVLVPKANVVVSAAPTDPVELSRLADGLVAAEKALRSPDRPSDQISALARAAQAAYRAISARPEALPRVLERVPPALRPVIDANVTAGAELRALTKPRTELPPWRILTPPPAEELERYYKEAEARSGIPWRYLAAVHLVETRMGRIRGASTAGAEGPMQFLPSTWARYGEGGDINSARDSILAAARYLKAAGGPGDMAKALYAYNHSNHYVRAVTLYADQIAAEPRIYPAYWNWQVYYITTVGDVWLEEGYGT